MRRSEDSMNVDWIGNSRAPPKLQNLKSVLKTSHRRMSQGCYEIILQSVVSKLLFDSNIVLARGIVLLRWTKDVPCELWTRRQVHHRNGGKLHAKLGATKFVRRPGSQ